MAYESNIIPTQSLWADELNTQLLPEMGDPDNEFVDWDYSKVRVLQDDENKKANKYAVLYAGGIIKRSEARADLGYDVTPEDEAYKAPAAPMLPPAQPAQDEPQATTEDEGAKAHTNGHIMRESAFGQPYVHTYVAGNEIFIPNGNGFKARKRDRDDIIAAVQRDMEGEIMGVYKQVEGAL